jgi:hypothetical protein
MLCDAVRGMYGPVDLHQLRREQPEIVDLDLRSVSAPLVLHMVRLL